MSIRVLIADPDRTLLASYQARLSQAGFEVHTVMNGIDCLDALHSFEPDLLILEPEMPWGGGDGVLDVMHDVSELPPVPVFVITSHATLARLNLRQLPLVTHMQTKPIRPDELVSVVRQIVHDLWLFEDDPRSPALPPGAMKGNVVSRMARQFLAATLDRS